ncbi:Telomeric repeat-binding factor 2 [Dermatophilus congolensis]|uniref:Telomeric repeat-binding factor 2 n=1 Tax=Dermatophilus congolensis TaxID=1863 RepID=A0A239V914_9MICO|nr:DUF4352 domain-containing protein [Dermatophilus congolensis]SNV18651.1 Telomeric repeat-binding factor 2 [Dermatophilus congolensis]
MSSSTRQRPNAPGPAAADTLTGGARRRAAAPQASRAQKKQKQTAEEIASAVRAEAARRAALPPWYLRKRYVAPLFAGGLAAVAAISLMSSIPGPAAPPPVKVTPTIASASIGKPFKDGDMTFTIRSIALPGSTIGETVAAEKARGTWVLVTVDITNKGTGSNTIDVAGQRLTTANNAVHDAAVVPSLSGWDDAYISGIAPNSTTTAQIAFDIPAGSTPAVLTLRGGHSGAGAKVPLR